MLFFVVQLYCSFYCLCFMQSDDEENNKGKLGNIFGSASATVTPSSSSLFQWNDFQAVKKDSVCKLIAE